MMDAKEALDQLYAATKMLQLRHDQHVQLAQLFEIVQKALAQNDNGELQRQTVDQLER